MNEADGKVFPFADAPDTAAIVCRHVLEEGAPVTYVSHDEDDGMWQFLCGGLHETADARLHETADARLVSLYSVWKRDESVGGLCEMPPGFVAWRSGAEGGWRVGKRRSA